MTTEETIAVPGLNKGRVRRRLFAATALAMFGSVVAYAGHELYRAATDSFVAPIWCWRTR